MQSVTLQLPEKIAAQLAASSADTAARVKVELALNLGSTPESAPPIQSKGKLFGVFIVVHPADQVTRRG